MSNRYSVLMSVYKNDSPDDLATALKSIYDEYTELSRSKDPEIYRLSQTVLYSIYMLTGKIEDMKIDTDQFRRLTEERG